MFAVETKSNKNDSLLANKDQFYSEEISAIKALVESDKTPVRRWTDAKIILPVSKTVKKAISGEMRSKPGC